MSDELPPLPEADQQGVSSCGYYATDLYTADQMREHAKQAVEAEREACAQIATQKLWAGEVVANAIRARGNT